MSENKMADVAKLLGVELGEDFEVIGYKDRIFRLTRYGLHQLDKGDPDYSIYIDNNIKDALDKLLRGTLQIKKKPWKAKHGEIYFVPHPTCRIKYGETTVIGWLDDLLYNRGLMCKTKEQAVTIADAMIKVAREMQGIEDNKED